MELTKEEIQASLDDEIKNAEKQFGPSIKFTITRIIGLMKMLYPEQQQKRSRLIPLAKWEEYHDYPTEGALRQYYNRREKNGFGFCVEPGGENGTRILINEDKFFVWQNNRGKRI